MVKSDSAADKAYKALLRDLNLRRLLPGERLPAAAELADEIGVSRPAVLHAFNRLQSEGRLTVRAGRGGVHANPMADSRPVRLAWARSPERKLDELVAVVELVEPGGARRVALRGIDHDHVVAARDANERLLASRTIDEYLRAENDFHIALGDATGAVVIGSLTLGFRATLSSMYDLLDMPEPDREAVAAEHETLLTTILAGRAADASDLAARHVQPILDAIVEKFVPDQDAGDQEAAAAR